MKATTLISVFLFAHAAFAQATESTSTSVSAGTVPASGSTATASVSAPAPESTTKSAAGAKSASKSEAQSSSAAGTPNSQPAATGSPATQTPSTSDPLIPSTISEGCSSYLNTLNTDPEIANCLAPLSDALSGYSASTGSASALSKTLTKLCSTKTCSSSTIRAKLTEFKDTCSEELTGANPNQVVVNNYDVLYTAVPFRDAVCAKDFDSQTYCLLNATASAAATISESVAYAASHMTNSVSLRRKRAQTVLVPNPDTYRNSNLLYLFTSPNMAAGDLCISCTQQILAKYFSWQQAVPHALGAGNSPLLGGQSELYSTIREKCPLSFADGISTVANVATAEGINSASPASVGSLFTAAAGALAAVMALL